MGYPATIFDRAVSFNSVTVKTSQRPTLFCKCFSQFYLFIFFSIKVFFMAKIYFWETFFYETGLYLFSLLCFLSNSRISFSTARFFFRSSSYNFLSAKTCCALQKIILLFLSLVQSVNLIVSRNEIEAS